MVMLRTDRQRRATLPEAVEPESFVALEDAGPGRFVLTVIGKPSHKPRQAEEGLPKSVWENFDLDGPAEDAEVWGLGE